MRGALRLAASLWCCLAILFFSGTAALAQDCGQSEQNLREQALASTDPSLSQRYIECYPNSEHVLLLNSHLKKVIELQAFRSAMEAGTPGPLVEFVKEYPGSEHKQEAIARIAELRRLFGYSGSRLQGTELVDLSTPDAASCLEQCLGRKECNGFTHFADQRRLCRLWATVTHHIPDPSAVSGSRQVVPEAPPQFVSYPNSTLTGQVVLSGTTGDAAACQRACASRAECEGYTYFSDRSLCSLWRAVSNRMANAGANSGARREVPEVRQPPPAATPGFQYHRNVDFSGGDMPGMPIRDISQAMCEQGCANNAQCAAYTYNIERSACFHKYAVVSQMGFPGAVSAIKPNRGVAVPPPSAAIEVFRDVDLENPTNSSRDLARRDGIDLAACHALCASTQACRAYTYNVAALACFLKSGYTRARRFPGAVSGIKQ